MQRMMEMGQERSAAARLDRTMGVRWLWLSFIPLAPEWLRSPEGFAYHTGI